MTGTINSNRSASLNMSGVSVKILQKFLNELPPEAQKSGRVTIQSTPYINQFDVGSDTLMVSWSEDLGPAPAA